MLQIEQVKWPATHDPEGQEESNMIADELKRLNAIAECQDHISQLRLWIRNHPKQQGTVQYEDRVRSLYRWLEQSQRTQQS
jgi:hypothetical protein